MSRVIVHTIIGLLISLILFPIFGWGVLIIFLVNSLIDVDHLLNYWFAKGFSLNIIRINKEWCNIVGNESPRRKMYFTTQLFHTIEFFGVLLIASWVFNYWLVLIGFVIHLFVDFIDESSGILKPIESGRIFSITKWLYKVSKGDVAR